MISRYCTLPLLGLLGVLLLSGCNNTLNPLCGSARPVPSIASLSPSIVTFSDVQQGTDLTVNGNNFVSASEVLIDGKALGATILSKTQMTIKLTTDIISAPGAVKVSVKTPAGNTGDLGCSSGGTSSTLTLMVN